MSILTTAGDVEEGKQSGGASAVGALPAGEAAPRCVHTILPAGPRGLRSSAPSVVLRSCLAEGTRHSVAWHCASMDATGRPEIFTTQEPSAVQSSVDLPLAELVRPVTKAAGGARRAWSGAWEARRLRLRQGDARGARRGAARHSRLPHEPLGQPHTISEHATADELGLMTQPARLHSTGAPELLTTNRMLQLPGAAVGSGTELAMAAASPPPGAAGVDEVSKPVRHCSSRLLGTIVVSSTEGDVMLQV